MYCWGTRHCRVPGEPAQGLGAAMPCPRGSGRWRGDTSEGTTFKLPGWAEPPQSPRCESVIIPLPVLRGEITGGSTRSKYWAAKRICSADTAQRRVERLWQEGRRGQARGRRVGRSHRGGRCGALLPVLQGAARWQPAQSSGSGTCSRTQTALRHRGLVPPLGARRGRSARHAGRGHPGSRAAPAAGRAGSRHRQAREGGRETHQLVTLTPQ